jgi:hypothetical protein
MKIPVFIKKMNGLWWEILMICICTYFSIGREKRGEYTKKNHQKDQDGSDHSKTISHKTYAYQLPVGKRIFADLGCAQVCAQDEDSIVA